MGNVYRAKDVRLGREVALKVMADHVAADPEMRRRFEIEARAVAGLSHPCIMAIHELAVIGGVSVAVMELLEGETLRARISKGVCPWREAVRIAAAVADGLAAAHARGVIHRDLKPENIFVTSDGRVKILDFGLSKHLEPLAEHAQSLTRPETMHGTVLGTIGYMAPEQVRGFEMDQRADIFAAGAILFEMLTGRRAFQGASAADTMSAILNDPPSALVFNIDTPPSLARIVRRSLEKKPHDRFQSAQDLAFALESSSGVRSGPADAPDVAGEASIAVLPFANIGAAPDNQYFSDGLAEDLIIALTRLSGLRVVSRTSSFRFRGHDADVREIGRDLGVSAIVEGSVRRSGTRLRITAQLTNTATGYNIWSGRFDREMTDVFAIQDEIVESIVNALAPALLDEAALAVRRSTENLEAYELYLKGRHFWNQRSPVLMSTAIGAFEEAIELDPAYALAYAGLADCHSILRVYGWTRPDESQPRALDAVSKALALQPDLPEAHFSRALYTFHFEPHWRTARGHFVDALRLSPRMAVFEAYFALFLATEYAHDEARRHLARALELDPHSSVVNFLAAASATLMSDTDAAASFAGRALELEPESLGARWPQTIALLISGHLDEAIAVGEGVVARARAAIYVGVLAMAYGCAGRLADAERLGHELDDRQNRGEYILPAARLSVSLGLGDLGGIRTWLAACVDGGAAPFSVVATSRLLADNYRSDPEIDRLLDRLYDGARPAGR
jgi:TolB-like protein/tRNA A-37 threonylcarbamoyl transferase component Bud32/Tfp pilus assembly protein PilF